MYEKVNWVGSTQRMFAISQKNSRKAILLMKLQVLQKNYGVFDIFSSNNENLICHIKPLSLSHQQCENEIKEKK